MLRQLFPHLRNILRQLGPLGQNSGIHIPDAPSPGPQQPGHMVQQDQTVRSRIGRVMVRKVFSDVPQSGRSQQGIHNRMGQYICIGVAQQSHLIGDLHPA